MKKLIASAVLLGVSAVAFYCALYWGWASGALSPSNADWTIWFKRASNVAFVLSLVFLSAVLAMWLLPLFRKKKKAGAAAG